MPDVSKKSVKMKKKSKVQAHRCATIVLCTREPGDSSYCESDILYLSSKELAQTLWEKVTGGESLGSFVHLKVGSDLSTKKPISDLAKAETKLRRVLEDFDDCEGNRVSDILCE